jgi:uncharacterized protein (DUF1800 family)
MSAHPDPWAPYEPSPDAPWNLRRVVHLHRRAGFAATSHEIERDLRDGHEASIARVLDGKVRKLASAPNLEATAAILSDGAITANSPERLKAAWVFRMLCGADPLGERLTLMWHDHFATSNAKVNDLAAMRRQNELLRVHARAPFATLLNAVVRDPALLVWLDASGNRKGHPNENLARELMELFTLGIGNYTESDVRECARALTGWTVVDGAFQEQADQHDTGPKTILDQRGAWNGADVLKALAERPSTARRLTSKLCGLFFGEPGVPAGALESLACGLHAHDLDIGQAVATILRSQAFLADNNIGSRVQSPAEYVVGATIALGRSDPPPSTLVLADWMTRLGQDLFYPPNVGGWPGGRSWLSSRGLIGRANFAGALVAGRPVGLATPLDAAALAAERGREAGPLGVFDAVSLLLTGSEPSARQRDLFMRTIGTRRGGDAARDAATIVLASPEAQLA